MTVCVVLSPPIQIAPGAMSGYPICRRVPNAAIIHLATGVNAIGRIYTGAYFVAGTVTIDAAPVARKVRLYFLNNGHLVDEAWSDPVTGAYRFENLELAEYYVWSEDHPRVYDPVSHLVPLQSPP